MRSKKIISLVLVLTTIISIFVLPVSAVEKIENQIMVYYYNENNWKSPYIYYYCDNYTPDTWPGKEMTSFGDGWYGYTINNLKTTKVIFSDNGLNQNPGQNQEGYLVEGEQWYKKGTWYQTCPEPQTTKVHYYNENGWDSPYIYYYTDNEKPVTWPGTAMKSDGGNWYSFSVTDIDNVKVIFSNKGANQSPSQNQEGYSVSGEKWYLNGNWYDSEPNGITVHFNNYNDWDNVNIYYYNGNKTGTSWTGNPMIPDGDGWYTYKIYGFDEARVLFNNGKGIQIPGQNQEGFVVSGEMWYRNGEWTTERPDDITVYFYKPDNWSVPNIYYYKDINDTGKAWPGNAMSFVSDNWYSYTITKYSSAKVLFNSGSNQIPPQNQPGFEVKGIVWYKDGVMCNAETDADNDGLPDYMELILGTNLNNKDTDSDGLPDGYEVLTLGTDPLKADTDGNGVKDSNEDADGDKLANLEEYKLGTSPINPDTDGDGLNDYEEVYTYHTDPLNADTDGDTLSDGDDVALGFSPLLKDTDSNGILDCDEKIKQEITQEIKNEEAPQISEVQVSFEGTGNINNTTTIEDIYGKDMLSSEVVGLIGSPVEITTTSEFESAVITFKYDKSQLGDTKEEDLAVMWYDEENGVYQILDNETVLDKEKQTVSYKTTHFSKYMVVDKNIWYNTWRTNIDYREGTSTKLYYDFAFVVDTSGSMGGQSINYAKQSMNNFVDCLTDSDNACLVSFESNAYLKAPLGATKETLHSAINSLRASGGTYVSKGLNMALNQLTSSTSGNQKAIVIICDGDVDSVQSYVNTAKANNIKIFAINVISADNDILQYMADETGGEYYYAYTAEELLTAFSHISSESLFNFDLTDTDGDGLPDTFEKNGMRLANGKIVYTDPNNPDTDGDGLTDGEEMGILRRSSVLISPPLNLPTKALPDNGMYIGNGLYSLATLYFNGLCDPTLVDSDEDGISDDEELIIETDPFDTDTDGDGLDDGTEVANWFDPLEADADNDGRLDKQEFDEGTDPFNYDKDWDDYVGDFLYGFVAGDFIKETDSLATMMGQVTSSFIPLVDIRNVIGNLVNGDYIFAGLSAVGLIPVVGDTSKAVFKVGKFVAKNSDNVAKSAQLLKFVEKTLPDVAKSLNESEDFLKAAEGISKLDNIKISRKSCEALTEVFETAGKSDTLIKTSNSLPIRNVVDSKGAWTEKPLPRGRILDETINKHEGGQGLGKNFPVADRLEGTTLVSTKSVDLGAQSYQSGSRLKMKLRKDLNSLDQFEAKYFKDNKIYWGETILERNQYNNKALEIVVPDMPITESTKNILDDFKTEAENINIEVWYVIAK